MEHPSPTHQRVEQDGRVSGRTHQFSLVSVAPGVAICSGSVRVKIIAVPGSRVAWGWLTSRWAGMTPAPTTLPANAPTGPPRIAPVVAPAPTAPPYSMPLRFMREAGRMVPSEPTLDLAPGVPVITARSW